MKGSSELGATALIDGKGIGAIAKLFVADHQTLVELLMEVGCRSRIAPLRGPIHYLSGYGHG